MTTHDERGESWVASLLDDDELDRPGPGLPVSADDGALVEILRTLARMQALHRSPDPIAFAAAVAGSAEPGSVPETTAPPPSPPEAGEGRPQQWGPLEIRGQIGQGGFGIVYRAHDPTLDLEVALKLLPIPRGESSATPDTILREARLLARVRHPNVARVLGADQLDGHVGFWMELIEGRTLEKLVSEQGTLGEKEAGVIGLDLIRALAAVHAAGVLHRDVKARNVMREAGGRIVLMDFGSGVTTGNMPSEMSTSTAGTPLYLAPELFWGDPPTVRSDLYSLGVLLYFLVTGSHPVQGRSIADLAHRHESKAAVPLRQARPDLGLPFIQVVDRALAHDPQDRYADAAEMEKALAAAMGMEADGSVSPGRRSTRATWARRPSSVVLRWGAVVALLAVIMLLVWPFLPSGDGGYAIDASLLRQTAMGWERVLPGTRLAPRDRLIMEIEPSEAVHAYVLNWDDRGNVYLLFPIDALDLENPLPGETVHRLPGADDNWAVSSVGGHEHFLVVASRERLSGFEETLASLPAPHVAGAGSAGGQGGAQAGPATVPDVALEALVRGVGWLESGTDDAVPPGDTGDMVERISRMADELARSPRTRDVWVSKIVVENPDR